MASVSMDFCRVQRLINELGGSGEFTAFPKQSWLPGDRLIQYGFQAVNEEGKCIAPRAPGVYAITVFISGLQFVNGKHTGAEFMGAEHLLYIGSSKDMYKRVYSPGHWWERVNERLFSIEHHTHVRWIVTNDYLWAERSLIRTLRPLLNIHHNG